MPQFFSDAPVDFGARYIAQGYAGLADGLNGVAGQINGITQRANEKDMLKLRAATEEQMRQSELERQLTQEAGQYGITPVMDQSGKLNSPATAALVLKAKDMHDRINRQAQMSDAYNLDLAGKARQFGIQPTQGDQAKPGTGPMSLGRLSDANRQQPMAAPFQAPAVPLEKQIYDKEQEQKIAERSALAKASAEANAPFRERYVDKGPFQKGGQYIGNAVRDGISGKIGMMKDGAFVPLEEGAEPITATGLNKSIPTQPEFRKLKGDLTSAEISLHNMDRYINSVGDANMGIQRLADNFSANMKTLIGSGELNPKEMAIKMAQGQMQGLLGANRTNVVGGGVMTEQDALRIIERLGGDAGALSNPSVVKQAIAQVYSDRFKQYQDDYNFYNAAVEDYYGAKGFKKADPVPFSGNFSNDYAGAPQAPATPKAPETPKSPFSGMTTEALEARRQQLLGGK